MRPGTIRDALAFLLCCILGGSISKDSVAQTFSDPGFTSELVATVQPFSLVGMAWAPDGRLFVWEKNGVVRIIKQGVLLPTPFIDLRGKVNTLDDRGLWGLAFHPDFSNNGFVYLSYVYEEGADPNDPDPKTSRLTRVTASSSNPDVALAGSEVIILGSIATPPCSVHPAGADCIPADSGTHSLGTLRFAPDGTLFVGNGDGAEPGFVDPRAMRAQDLDSWSGKILRIREDGTAPADNPFYDGTNSIRSKVWLYGVRNPFRFNLHPLTNQPYFGDVGWNNWEEVNRGLPGNNYGWPCYEGNSPQSGYQNAFVQCQQLAPATVTAPLYTYSHSVGVAAIAGPIYTGDAYPNTYLGSLFFADYSGFILRMLLDTSGNSLGVVPFATSVEAPVTLELGPDGMLYYLSFTTGQIRRIRFNGPSAVASATPTSGYSPLVVSFSSAGSTDPGGSQLTYLWDFGDGNTSTLPNPNYTYVAAGVANFTATLTVRNSGGVTSSTTLTITIGSLPPTPTISAPANGTTVVSGATVVYQGSATDPDQGALPPAALSWTVLLHHNSHVHSFVGSTGSQGSFVAESHGTIGTFSYEIILTATDSSGLSASTSVLLPVVGETVPPSAPNGLTATAAGATQINLAWTSATDNIGVTGYRVERCQVAGCTNFVEVATRTSTSFVDGGRSPETAYVYRVRAFDAAGNLGPYSNVATATTPSPPPIVGGLVAAYAFNEAAGTAVADASGNGNTGSVNDATWTPSGRFGGALSFNGWTSIVHIPPSPSLNLFSAMTLEAWIFPTASQSGWRTIMQREVDAYFLSASNSGGALQPSGGGTFDGTGNHVSGTIANPVNAWTHLAMTYDGATLRLYVNGTLAASRAQTGNVETNANPMRIGGNFPYGEFFQGLIDEVRVYNRALSQAEIQSDMATPIVPNAPDTTPPSAPTDLSATATSATQVNLAWTAATDNIGVNGYRVERCQGTGCANFVEVATPTGASYNDTGRSPATSYSYRVRAVDAAGNLGPYSNIASATTPSSSDTTPPSAPTSLSAAAVSATQVNLGWTAATDNIGVTGYRVERCQGAGCANFVEVATPTGASFNDTAVSGATSYRYQVRAADAAGNLGPYSNIATATTPSLPPPVIGLVAAYAFNEGTGTIVGDTSGNGNSGTINGATWSPSGHFGGALSFDGLSNRVQIAASPSLNVSSAMTLEAWIFPTAAQSGWRTIMQREADAYFLNASNGNGPMLPGGGGTFSSTMGYVSGSVANPVNTWTHVALTYDGAALRLYVNGALAGSAAQTGNVQSTTNPLSIGGNGPYGEFFQGLIDEVRVYNRALSQAEIQYDMGTPIVPTAPDTTPPSAPSSVIATPVSATQVNLAWAAATDNVGVTGYRLERCQGSGCTNFAEIATPTGTSYNDTAVSGATDYSYRVRATDAAGNLGLYSNIASATTPEATPPSAPSGLTATAASATQINLAWTAATDNVGVTGYRLERCQGASCTNFAQIATPTGTSFNDTGRTASTTYRYRVRASDAAGNLGAYSSIATATTPAATDTTPPSAPSGLTATAVSATQINLAWTAATDNVAVTDYRVERCQGSGCTNFAQIATPTGTSYNDSGRTGATTYRYRVRAADAAGNLGSYSNIATATTPDATPPSAPTALTATAVSATRINLAWTAATDNVAVTGYRVERCQGSGCTNFAQIATPNGTSYGDTGRTGATTYRYRVRAADAAGNLGPYSNIASATTLDATPPSAPSGLTATAASATQINLAWTAATDNVGVTGYRLERCQGASCTNFAQIATPTGTSFNDIGRTASTTYRYRVRATDAAGNLGVYSSIATATTPAATDTTPPSAPSGLTATAVSATQINLAWTSATDNVAVTGYRVERCQGSGCTNFAQIATPTGTSFNDTGRSPTTGYSYQVRAVDAAGNVGLYSNIASATTPDLPPPSGGLVAAYAFNEASGLTVSDTSGNGNTGTINGATWTPSGRFGAALSFNGSSNLVQIPGSPSLNVSSAMTLEAWIFPTTSQNGWRTIMQREADAYFLNASNSGGPLLPSGGGTFGGAVAFVSGTAANPVSAWTHVALTYDGATLRLYVNGVEAASQARTGGVETNANPLSIGGNSPYGEFFQGLIDEVRVYNRALSQAEILSDMTTPIIP